MLEDTLKGLGKPMTPRVIKLLETLSPKMEARDWMLAITILYMAPGGYRQWPMSITALLDRLSWIVLQTRPIGTNVFSRGNAEESHLATQVSKWTLGRGWGSYKLGEHVPKRHDIDNIYHPRYIRQGIPPVNTFHAVVHGRAAKWVNDVDEWCLEEAWFQHSVNHDFRVTDPAGTHLGTACYHQKLFAQSPRQKYVDIVTDTIHASSSDLITWNTLGHDQIEVGQPHPKNSGLRSLLSHSMHGN